MNDELFKALKALVGTTEKYYAAHPEYKATEAQSADPALADYDVAFANAKRALKKYAPILKQP